MDTEEKRKRLHAYIDNADDETLQEIYALILGENGILKRNTVEEPSTAYLKTDSEIKQVLPEQEGSIEEDDDIEFELTPDQIAILDDEYEKHIKGEGKSYTWQEVDHMIRNKIPFDENSLNQIPEEQIAIAEEEFEKYLMGEGKSYTWEEAKEIIRGKMPFDV